MNGRTRSFPGIRHSASVTVVDMTPRALPRPPHSSLRVLVVIPTYNERASIGGVTERLLAADPRVAVLIVDDASPDGTGEVAAGLAARDDRVFALHRSGKQGLGTAYRDGFQWGLAHGYDVLVECDGDGSHQPEQLGALLGALASGADVALGSRWIPGGAIVGWPRHREWISRTGTWVARIALGSRLHDLTSGYRALRAEAVRRLPLETVTSQGYGFQVETAWALERFGERIVEVPITFIERQSGRSKMSAGIVIEALGAVLRWGALRVFAPGRLPGPVGD